MAYGSIPVSVNIAKPCHRATCVHCPMWLYLFVCYPWLCRYNKTLPPCHLCTLLAVCTLSVLYGYTSFYVTLTLPCHHATTKSCKYIPYPSTDGIWINACLCKYSKSLPPCHLFTLLAVCTISVAFGYIPFYVTLKNPATMPPLYDVSMYHILVLMDSMNRTVQIDLDHPITIRVDKIDLDLR